MVPGSNKLISSSAGNENAFSSRKYLNPSQVIAADLHGTFIQSFWAGTSALLAATTLQPVLAALSNVFGRKNIILVAITFFLVGSLMSAVSQSFKVLLAGRAIQGIGSGGIIALTYVLATDFWTLAERGKWWGILAASHAIGAAAGPAIGGALAQKATWVSSQM